MIVSNDLSTLGSYKYALTERDKFPFEELARAAEERLALEGNYNGAPGIDYEA